MNHLRQDRYDIHTPFYLSIILSIESNGNIRHPTMAESVQSTVVYTLFFLPTSMNFAWVTAASLINTLITVSIPLSI